MGTRTVQIRINGDSRRFDAEVERIMEITEQIEKDKCVDCGANLTPLECWSAIEDRTIFPLCLNDYHRRVNDYLRRARDAESMRSDYESTRLEYEDVREAVVGLTPAEQESLYRWMHYTLRCRI